MVRRATLFLLGAVAVAVVLAVGASANASWNLSWNRQVTWLQACNDQESFKDGRGCVTDTPYGGPACAWGDQDDLEDAAFGKLSAGASTSDTLCLVTDPCSDFDCPHNVRYEISAGAGLVVTVTDDRGDSWTGTHSGSGKSSTYQFCLRDPLWTGSQTISDYPDIPGTNGGYGFVTYYTLTATATKTTQFSGAFDIGQNDPNLDALGRVPC